MAGSISRRHFLRSSMGLCAASVLSAEMITSSISSMASPGGEEERNTGQSPVEAKYYRKLDHKKVLCELCPKECRVDDLERGYCGVRENRGGTYYTLVHSWPCTVHVDPIEKKPLFHFHPGKNAFSFATVGCNMDCKFCQNWQISQMRPEQASNFHLPPEKLVDLAIQRKCPVIASTYTEPVVFTEYVMDVAKEGKSRGVKSVMISNGYIKEKPMKDLCGVLDAVKVDFKAYTDRFYREVCSGTLKPVLDTLKLLDRSGIWYELVYLVIPTLNDSEKEIREMATWMTSNLKPHVPVHFTRFHPQYRLKNLPPTPPSTIEKAREITMKAGMKFVYVGNIPGHAGENTYCPKCNTVVIRRIGFRVLQTKLKGNRCASCGEVIPGVF
jgi:pyruvate formate lyase activating enzyme